MWDVWNENQSKVDKNHGHKQTNTAVQIKLVNVEIEPFLNSKLTIFKYLERLVWEDKLFT